MDIQMRTNAPHIFAIGDIVGQPCWRTRRGTRRGTGGRGPPADCRGTKELASAALTPVIPSGGLPPPKRPGGGLTEEQAARRGIKVPEGLFPWAGGPAIANGHEGLYQAAVRRQPRSRIRGRRAGRGHGKILGGGMVGTHAGDMIGEIALAIEMGADRCRHRQDHPPASDAGREHRHGGGSGAWQLHGCAACAQVSPQPSYLTRPELATVRALCFAYPNNRRRILCICTVFMQPLPSPSSTTHATPNARCSTKR
ncbi:MAG: hypothetical protein IPG16_13870 [Comamonadaceae bacterium]|nr:hypothetical protein [Comamonadaceae bacterium]